MKKINFRIMCISCLIVLIPIILGIVNYNNISDVFAIHFSGSGGINSTVSKVFGVFYTPILIIALQIALCLSLDIKGEKTPFINIVKSIIPLAYSVLQISLIYYNMGVTLDVRKWSAVVVGLIFIVLGNYLPKESYVTENMTNLPKSLKGNGRYKIINKRVGYSFVVAGFILILYFLIFI